MNKEKELLLKLLMEKYEGKDLDDDCEKSGSGWEYSPYGGAKYEIVEPEVWEEFDLGGCDPYGNVGRMVREALSTAQVELVGVMVSSYNNVEFSFKGGDPNLIARALWMTRTANFGLKGDLMVMIRDGFNQEHIVSFNYEYE